MKQATPTTAVDTVAHHGTATAASAAATRKDDDYYHHHHHHQQQQLDALHRTCARLQSDCDRLLRQNTVHQQRLSRIDAAWQRKLVRQQTQQAAHMAAERARYHQTVQHLRRTLDETRWGYEQQLLAAASSMAATTTTPSTTTTTTTHHPPCNTTPVRQQQPPLTEQREEVVAVSSSLHTPPPNPQTVTLYSSSDDDDEQVASSSSPSAEQQDVTGTLLVQDNNNNKDHLLLLASANNNKHMCYWLSMSIGGSGGTAVKYDNSRGCPLWYGGSRLMCLPFVASAASVLCCLTVVPDSICPGMYTYVF